MWRAGTPGSLLQARSGAAPSRGAQHDPYVLPACDSGSHTRRLGWRTVSRGPRTAARPYSPERHVDGGRRGPGAARDASRLHAAQPQQGGHELLWRPRARSFGSGSALCSGARIPARFRLGRRKDPASSPAGKTDTPPVGACQDPSAGTPTASGPGGRPLAGTHRANGPPA